jgi:hypothetical protein
MKRSLITLTRARSAGGRVTFGSDRSVGPEASVKDR